MSERQIKFGDALNTVRQAVNTFKALKELENLVEAGADLEASKRRLEQDIAKLERDRRASENALEKAQDDHRRWRAVEQNKAQDVVDRNRKKRDELAAKFAEEKAEAESHLEELRKQNTAEEDRHRREIAALYDKKKELEETVKRLETRLSNLKKAVGAL